MTDAELDAIETRAYGGDLRALDIVLLVASLRRQRALPVIEECGMCSLMRTYGTGPVSGGPDRGAYCGCIDIPNGPRETWVDAEATPPSWCPLRPVPLSTPRGSR